MSSVTPASLGEHGPGDSSTRSGFKARASAGVISLLRNTRCSTPNWPKYWTRLKVKESKLSMTSSMARRAVEQTERREGWMERVKRGLDKHSARGVVHRAGAMGVKWIGAHAEARSVEGGE